MARLKEARTMCSFRLKNETQKLIKDDADRMNTYQSDIIEDATRLYSNLYDVWEDERKSDMSFEEFLEDLF